MMWAGSENRVSFVGGGGAGPILPSRRCQRRRRQWGSAPLRRGDCAGRPKWKLLQDEWAEMDVSALRVRVCRSRAVRRTVDADDEEWSIYPGEAERILGTKHPRVLIANGTIDGTTSRTTNGTAARTTSCNGQPHSEPKEEE